MLIKKIEIENIRSYEKQQVSFPKGSTLLAGDIGSGKTTLLLAIEFALFGLQPSQKASSLLRNGAENGKVLLEFEIGDKNIIIERTLKKGKTICQDYSCLTINNEKFEGSVTEIKSRILDLLNYPSEFSKKTNLLYKFTVYTPQEEMKQIVLEPGDIRLNTLRHVFGIDKYKRIEENAEILASKLREKIRISEAMVQDLENDKLFLLEKEKSLIDLQFRKKQVSLEYETAVGLRIAKEDSLKEVSEKIAQKKEFETEKSKSNLLIFEKKQQITSIKSNIAILSMQVEEANKITFSKEEFDILNEKIKFQEKKEEDSQKEYIQVISYINANESRVKESEEIKRKIFGLSKCPTCLQEVEDSYKSNILRKMEDEINEIKMKLNAFASKKKQLYEEIDSIKKIKENLRKQKSEQELLKIKLENILEKKQRIEDLEKQKQILEKDMEMLEKHIKLIDSSIEEYSKYDQLFEEKNNELKKARQYENDLTIKNAEINKEIQFLEMQIKEKQEQINKKESLRQLIEKLKSIEYWISERFMDLMLFTEKQVMLTLKDEFSRLFSKWFSILVSETLTAKLDDNFSPVIEQYDYELDYSFLSGGERTAVALAYRLALNQVINSLMSKIKTDNLVILDEPTDGFSAQQLDKMRDVLSQLNVEQLIIVSHEQKIESFVDNIIRVTKNSGSSKIE
jgi:DNA repair protein SbcC/Rad50